MIVITGTSGHLGRLVVEQLTQQVDPAGVIATARSLDAIAALADLGVATRELDYDRPDTIATALDGATQVLLVSSSEIGRRVPQHTAVIEAAVAAGVEHIAYTSILRAGTSPLIAAIEHRATEEVLARAGVTSTRLRHGWYIENYTGNLAPAIEHGAIIGSAGDGRIAAAARADYAAADAAVLADPSLRGGTYELGGHAYTMAEYAAAVSDVTGSAIPYVDLPADDYRGALVGAGLPGPLVDFLVDADLGIARGELDVDPSTLERLVGRPLTSLRDAVAAALR
jgi:NAD(P)H dehydrogenase (quinone)